MKKYIILILALAAGISNAQRHSPEQFVEVIKINASIRLDIRYATPDNFLKRAVYPQARCFLRYAAAVRLDSVQRELETIGLGLKIFDGYRPLSVQKEMWKILPDNRFVADPAKGSRHNRGAAVDVTLVDSLGYELPMPTAFDDFTDKAGHEFMKLPAEIRCNRWILKTIMQKYGFTALKEEWWHYDFKDWKRYDVCNLSFGQIDSVNAGIK